MSTKSVIQNLQDSELIRIFLEFVQTFHLQYEKIDKEISYKCHEATWILATTKATGYGRTESEAYKHALRNLLQILIEDPPYTEFFVNMLPTSGNQPPQAQNRTTQNLNSKQKPGYVGNVSKLYSHVSASLGLNQNGGHKKDCKTESNEIGQQDKQRVDKRYPTNFNQLTQHRNQYSINQTTAKYQTKNRNPASSTNTVNTSIYTTNYTKPNNYSQVPQERCSTKQLTQEVQASYEATTKNGVKSSMEVQLKDALLRNKVLNEELQSVNKENQMLRMQIQAFTQKNQMQKYKILNQSISYQNNNGAAGKNSTNINMTNKIMRLSTSSNNHNASNTYLQLQLNKSYLQPKNHLSSAAHLELANVQNAQGTSGNFVMSFNQSDKLADIGSVEFTNQESGNQENIKPRASMGHQNPSKSKVMIPKLKLDILPNYHKKAEKSLNDSLLAVYEQKYGAVDSTINMSASAQPIKKLI